MQNNEVVITPVKKYDRQPNTEKQPALSTIYARHKKLQEAYAELEKKYQEAIATVPRPVEYTTITDKELQKKLDLEANKNAELTKIVEGMKGQYGQLEQVLNNERLKNKATAEYVLDAVKHAYMSITMALKGGI